jgi:hypothetical protein
MRRRPGHKTMRVDEDELEVRHAMVMVMMMEMEKGSW